MNTKTLATVGLLLFVGAGVVTLVVKGARAGADSPETTLTTQTSDTGTTMQPPGEEAPRRDVQAPETTAQAVERETGEVAAAPTAAAAPPESKVVAYYFHGQRRCMSCNRIEELARSTLDTNFAGEQENGTLEFQSVNLDRQENRHFIADFNLSMNTVVLAIRNGDGAVAEFKRLDRVWQLLRSPEAFETFMREETQAYLETMAIGADAETAS